MDFLNGKIKPLYFHLLTASLGSALVASIFGIIDAMMVGQYHGPSGVAALSVFSPIWNIVYSLGILSGIGASILFANMRGSSNEDGAMEYFTLSVVFGAVLTLVMWLILAFFHDPMFRFFGADEELLLLVNRYLRPVWFAVPCCVFSNILSAFLRNDGAANLAMAAVLIGGGLNAIGDYLCIFVLDLGITGAGFATATGLFISTGIMLSHFFRGKNTLHFVRIHDAGRKLSRICSVGFPTAVSDVAMGVVTILFNRQIMKYLGVDALSVYGILAQIVPLVQCCAYGAGQAAQPILSQNLGAGKHRRIRECNRYAIGTSLVFGIFWIVFVAGFPNLFVYLFMAPTPEVLAIAPAIIRAYSAAFFFVPWNIYGTYFFQSLLKQKVALIVSLARGIVLPAILILLLPAVAGADRIWYAMPVTEGIVAVLCFLQMRSTLSSLNQTRE